MTSCAHRFVFEVFEPRLLLSGTALIDARQLLMIDHPPIDLGGGVVFLGRADKPIEVVLPANVNAGDTTNADVLWEGQSSGLDLSGDGVVVGVWEAA